MPSPLLTPEQAERQRKAMLGNNFGEALKTDESKIAAYKSYCEHLSKGIPKQAWYFRDADDNHCSWQTMEKMIKNKVFNDTHREQALAAGFNKHWSKGEELSSTNKSGGPQVRAWEFMMKMKYHNLFKEETDTPELEFKDID